MAIGYSLSTSWKSFRNINAIDVIDEMKEAGFDTIELHFKLSEDAVNQLHGIYLKSLVKVSSVHNVCPMPEGMDERSVSPDHYSLSSDIARRRKTAVEEAKKTILCARRFAAKAVVFHSGRVNVTDRTAELAAAAADPGAFYRLRQTMIEERRSRAARSVENVITSFRELLPFADDNGVKLALENRFYYSEIPLMDEMEEILANFRSGSLHYWHDVGHAEIFERLGFYKHKTLLDKFRGRLIGVHIHDIIGNIKDHQLPGTGSFDFSMLKPYIGNDTIKVLEVHGDASSLDLKKSVEYLNRALS